MGSYRTISREAGDDPDILFGEKPPPDRQTHRPGLGWEITLAITIGTLVGLSLNISRGKLSLTFSTVHLYSAIPAA